jgi:glycosyltransferase involved in cell wall biosynthesis
MNPPLDLTLYLIVRNEEIHLDNCLKSFQGIWKELLIVDTGSTDKTKEIAQKYNARILDFEWINDFSAARNFALANIKTDWIMMVDADDIIEEEDKNLLLEKMLDTIPQYDLTYLEYIYSGTKEKRLKVHFFPRIWKNHLGLKYERDIHETIFPPPGTKIIELNIPIIHNKQVSHKQSIERNLTLLKKNLKTNPDDELTIHFICEEYDDAHDLDNLIFWLKKYQTLKPSNPDHLLKNTIKLGISYLKKGEILFAKYYFEKAIKLKADQIDPYFYLAEMEINYFSPQKAIRLLTFAKQLQKTTNAKIVTDFDKKLYNPELVEKLLLQAYLKIKAT